MRPPLSFFISGEHMRWMDRGRCNGTTDWKTFFADERAKRRGLPAEVPPELEAVCAACEVRVECLNWALANDEEGVWGGTTRQQREAISRPIVRAKCPCCQGRTLFRAGLQQVCGDCGFSWQATRIHGDAHAPVPGVTDTGADADVIRLPVKWVWEQPALFDVTAYRTELVKVSKRRSCHRRRRVRSAEWVPIPGLDPLPVLPRQVRTRPTVLLRAA